MSWTDEFIDRVPSIAISVVAGVFGAFLTLIGMWALGGILSLGINFFGWVGIAVALMAGTVVFAITGKLTGPNR